jgi:hypothetical protein
MSLPILNVLENLGVSRLADELLVLNEPFDWTKTNQILDDIEIKLSVDIDLGKRKKIIKVVAEALDNVCKHSSKLSNLQVSCLLCHIDKDDNLYISTRNLVPNDQVGNLILKVQQLNLSNQDELNKLYRDQLKFGKLNEEGDAGLGLIEIARKSTEKIRYTFEYYDVKNSNFTFLITINIKTL